MGKKLMVVDDSSTIRNLIKNTVSSEGWDVVEAENGQEALDNLTPDIGFFVVDVNMPIKNGFEFVEEMKKDSKYSQKPVVFLTTESSDDMKSKGKALGVNGWIVKPFERETLLKIIDMLED